MNRTLSFPDQFNRLSKFINKHCRSSESGLVVNDHDYVIRQDNIHGVVYDYKIDKLLLVEEKTSLAANISRSQIETYAITDYCYRNSLPKLGIEYCGFSLIKWRSNNDNDGAFINGEFVTPYQLIEHLNLYKIVEGSFKPLDRATNYLVEMQLQ